MQTTTRKGYGRRALRTTIAANKVFTAIVMGLVLGCSTTPHETSRCQPGAHSMGDSFGPGDPVIRLFRSQAVSYKPTSGLLGTRLERHAAWQCLI